MVNNITVVFPQNAKLLKLLETKKTHPNPDASPKQNLIHFHHTIKISISLPILEVESSSFYQQHQS